MPRETGIAVFIDTRKAEQGAKRFEKSLDDIKDSARKATRVIRRGFGALRNTFGSLRIVIASVGIGLFIQQLIQINTASQRLEGSLVAVTGSLESARKEMGALQAFAASTPFSLEQSISAFVKLQNLGIKPTEERLRSFGNTSVAMGKSLSQFIEAVADAATNEFERLKEFGIKARQQADSVAFTFQGVTTKIKKNSEDIVNFLTEIGEANFAKAMEEQMKRLPGILSNLEESFRRASVAVGEAGFTQSVGDAAKALETFVTEFIESGRAEDIGFVLGGAFEAVAGSIQIATRLLSNFGLGLNVILSSFSDAFAGELGNPDNQVNRILERLGRGPMQGPPEAPFSIGGTLKTVESTPDQAAFLKTQADAEKARKRELELMKQKAEMVSDTLDDLAQERDDILKLNAARLEGVEAYNKATAEIEANNIARELGISLYSVEGQQIQSLITELQELERQAETTPSIMEDAFIGAVERMGDTLSDFFTTGKLDFASWAMAVTRDINMILTRQLIVQPFINSITGGTGGNAIGGILGGLFGGGGGGAPTGTVPFETPDISSAPIPLGQAVAQPKTAQTVSGGAMNVNVTVRDENGGLIVSDRQIAQQIGETVGREIQRKKA